MIHYHGTPIGGKCGKAGEFAIGRFLLIPWKRPDDLKIAMSDSRGFVADNSAFSFWRNGHKPDWSAYVAWVMGFANHPRFHWAIIPDVIDGDESENDYLIDFWQRVAGRIPGVPVWHLHESILRLQRLVMNWPRVCFGSSGEYANPGSDCWHDRMAEAFDAICDESGYPITKVHGLRMLNPDIIRRYPFASCDSTNAVQNGCRTAHKVGVDATWGQMTIARRIEMMQSPCQWNRRAEEQLKLPLCDGV